VLTFLLEKGDVWLAKKPAIKAGEKHKPGSGYYNGYGGGFDDEDRDQDGNLDPVLAAIRETRQESGIELKREHLEKRAVMDFHNETLSGSEVTCRVHIFFARGWSGRPHATGEMGQPIRYPLRSLPYLLMMPADSFWLPPVIDGHYIHGEAWHGPLQAHLKERGCVFKIVSPEYLIGLRPA
jgi:hypothetical protein